MNVPALVRTSVPKPEVVWNPANSYWQFCYPDENGSLEAPFAEMQPHGAGYQIQRLGYPSGPAAVDSNGKVLVSGMVDQP